MDWAGGKSQNVPNRYVKLLGDKFSCDVVRSKHFFKKSARDNLAEVFFECSDVLFQIYLRILDKGLELLKEEEIHLFCFILCTDSP